MRTSHEEVQSVPVEVIDDVICNRCGGSCKLDGKCFDDGPRVEPQRPHMIVRYASGMGGLLDASVCGGYDSRWLMDTIRYRFCICEKCLAELFSSFKVPPQISNYMDDDVSVDWESYKQAMQERWERDHGGSSGR